VIGVEGRDDGREEVSDDEGAVGGVDRLGNERGKPNASSLNTGLCDKPQGETERRRRNATCAPVPSRSPRLLSSKRRPPTPQADLRRKGKASERSEPTEDEPRPMRGLTLSVDSQTVVGDHLHALRHTHEKTLAVVRDLGLLAVQDLWDERDCSSEGRRDSLMAEADSKNGEVGSALSYELSGEPKVLRPIGTTRTGREDDAVDNGKNGGPEVIPVVGARWRRSEGREGKW
jgi:hypothetical protein